MRVALGLEYDGSSYCGWQSQASGCGVQDHVEAALAKFVGAETACTCAGRTDTGVHALAQVIHIDTAVERDAQSWVRGGNSYLPAGIRLLWAKPVPDDFHARFSARSRTYRYLLLNDAVASGTLATRLGWFHAPLDLVAMQSAAQSLLGERDFSAFRSSECQAKTPVKTLYDADIVARGKLLEFRFRANAFLHHMVRNLVGELVYVGSGRHSLEEFGVIVAGRDRTHAAPTFSAAGLYLTDIEYDDSFGLPAVAPRHPFFS
ncbi:MAG: tRNA pseudouridine(38-40) synthase TruA [Betaproteobacteria bacterium]|nr:tRNA pseudouridine(38-40) synthase TruA [Betaproteobacteria bacterium]